MVANIYLIEDHAVLQRILKEFFHRLPNLQLCGIAGSGQEALTEIPKLKPKLVLVDISLPDINGLEIVAELHIMFPDMLFLIFSSYSDEHYVKRALAIGARGYIVKGEPIELQNGIQQVLNGEIYLSPQIRSYVTRDIKE